jgi:hypothetical protein
MGAIAIVAAIVATRLAVAGKVPVRRTIAVIVLRIILALAIWTRALPLIGARLLGLRLIRAGLILTLGLLDALRLLGALLAAALALAAILALVAITVRVALAALGHGHRWQACADRDRQKQLSDPLHRPNSTGISADRRKLREKDCAIRGERLLNPFFSVQKGS